MINRKIDYRVIWQRAKLRPILLLFASQGVLFSLFLFIPLSLLMNSLKESFPYVQNADEIDASGTKTTGILTNIEAIENITINGNNPMVLSYEFDLNGQITQSKFSVFDPQKMQNLKEGDTISIKHLSNDSIALGYEQYSFSMDFMKYIAIAVMLVGLILFYLLFLRIKKEIDLYKDGKIIEGKVIFISHNKGFTFSKFGTSMDVHYEYESHGGNNNVGKSRTNNFALTNNKSIGDTIRILVSRDGKSSCLYPELIAKTNGWKDKYVA